MNKYSPIQKFFEVASPETLASLIRDIDDDMGLEARDLRAMARVHLDALVGEEDADDLVDHAKISEMALALEL